jgi:hypothetical protein
VPDSIGGDPRPSTDFHFTINFDTPEDDPPSVNEINVFSATKNETVENAIAIITRRLQEAESALEDAREAVDAATAAVDDANRRLEKTKQARIEASVAAKSAKSRAMLMDIEAQRAAEEATAIAAKVREQVKAARQAVKEAKIEADKAQDQIQQLTRAEETAAAEAVCAQDHLEKAQQRLKKLTHAIVEARSQLRMFADYGTQSRRLTASASSGMTSSQPVQGVDGRADTREKMLADLLEIENSLMVRRHPATSGISGGLDMADTIDRTDERRQHERLYYPVTQRPMFAYEGRTIPILDLSQTGMGLDPDAVVGQSHLVRGAIVFDNLPTMNVTGRVVHRNEQGLGLRLVTRIGNHILDQERRRLNA